MSMKNFDVKAFMLQKGERVALYAAALFMVLLIGLGLGLHGIGSGSAATTAGELTSLKDKGETALRASRPPESLKSMPDELKKAGILPAIDPSTFATANPFFTPSALDDTKWRKPEVLAPEEFQVDVIRCLVRSFIFSKGAKDELMVMYLKPSNNMTAPKQPAQPQGVVNPNLLRFMGRGPGGPGVNLPNGPGEIPGAAPGQQPDQATAQYDSRFVPIERLITRSNEPGFPAETTLPYRMAVIQAAFPYEKQLDAFRLALRQESNDQVLQNANFYFRGLKVERRSARGSGAFGDWKPLEIDENIRPLLTFGAEPEDPTLLRYSIIWPEDRLTMPQPMLARQQTYPAYDPKRLPAIEEAMRAIDKAGPSAKPVVKLKTPFDTGYDIYKINSTGTNPQGQPIVNPVPVPPSNPNPEAARGQLVPKYCLIRFLDPTIEPGFTYEYRVKVVMDNPLFNQTEKAISQDLTKDKEITAGNNAEAGWTVVPTKVKVDAEFAYYALGENYVRKGPMPVNPDRTWVQVQRWFDWVDIQGARYAIGDWSIAEQIPIVRGEYIGRVEEVDVPVWEPKAAAFQFAISPEKIKRSKKGIRVNISTGIAIDFSTTDLLVDFEGGKVTSPPIERNGNRTSQLNGVGGVELLILGADGKLTVRESNSDYADARRTTRLQDWKTWLDNVRKAGDAPKTDPRFAPKN